MDNTSLIFSNKVADIYYYPNNKMLIAIYHGLVEYNLLQEIIELINATAVDKGIAGALADVTKLRGSYQRLLGYMEDTGAPLLIENGYIAQAQIISDDLIMKNLSAKVEKIMTSLSVNFKVFTDRKEGEEWLNKVLAKQN